MPNIPRNSPCPCGSGKKYKRCCVDKPMPDFPKSESHLLSIYEKEQERFRKEHTVFKKYNSGRLLKIFSVLQLQAANHGKNIRIETAIVNIINDLNTIQEDIGLEILRKDVIAACKHNFAEDPPEEFFTENISFKNGNNTVFPGISTHGTEIVQGLIDSIHPNSPLPIDFIIEANAGISLLLYIHDHIAKSLGLSHRVFEENLDDDLFVPEREILSEQMKLFSFSQEFINSICDKLNIPRETFSQFVFDTNSGYIQYGDGNSNPLLQRPFIFYENEFILVMPSAQLVCMNEHILKVAGKYSCLEALIKRFATLCHDELMPVFGRMQWNLQQFKFPVAGTESKLLFTHQSLWRIDTDKLVYGFFVTIYPEFFVSSESDIKRISNEFTKISSASLSDIKKQFPNDHILMVNITQKCRIVNAFALSFSKEKAGIRRIFFSHLELQVLARVWKFDALTLWKYAKYLEQAEQKISFAPLNTHYSKFKWYQRNEESFFDTDEANYDSAAFGFEIESEVKRSGIKKMDKISIPFLESTGLRHIHCYRKEEYYPAYISKAVNYGFLLSCYLQYSCPIWITSLKDHDAKAEVYINGILYWLHELYDTSRNYINQLGSSPVHLLIKMDDEFYNLNDLEKFDNAETSFRFSIDKDRRRITFTIPIQILQFIASANNAGEQQLMAFILDMLGDLMKVTGVGTRLPVIQRDEMISACIPFGNRKMIITTTADRDPSLAEMDIDDYRTIPKADVSFVLENQVRWLNYSKSIPKKIKEKKEKIKLFNDIVTVHFNKVKELISVYKVFPLLLFLMKRHEALIHQRAFRKINYPVKAACYQKYMDVYEEFSETEKALNVASLSMRVLIEFVACLHPKGTKNPNDDDTDIMLAHVNQLIQYGFLSDELKYDILDMDVGLLPSGRIGINSETRKNAYAEFSDHVYGEEFESYSKDFEQFFRRRNEEANKPKQTDPYVEKVDNAFLQEWGIRLYDIGSLSYFLANYILHQGKSLLIVEHEELIKIIKGDTDFTEKEINAYLQQLTFVPRKEIETAPEGYAASEVYPWRYNRRLSYLVKPILFTKKGKKDMYLIGARLLWKATENLIANFHDGTLKIDAQHKSINQFLAGRNAIKGKSYRNKVNKWLNKNTALKVIEYEVKINSRGFFKANRDMGDIDILAIDEEYSLIYSIECKNTSQAKVAYEYRRELDNYLGIPPKPGLIQKHINRHTWLLQNKIAVCERLGLATTYQIVSIVISKNILPTKFLSSPEIPIISFFELKKYGLPLLKENQSH